MKQTHRSFDQMLDLLRRIPDDDVPQAITIVRRFRTGADVRASPKRLVAALREMSEENRLWLESVLCFRAQQAGRERAWMRFASSSFWDLTSSYAAPPPGAPGRPPPRSA